MAGEAVSAKDNPPSTSDNAIVGINGPRERVDGGGLTIASSMRDRGELKLDLCCVPKIIGIQECDKLALRFINPNIPGFGYPAIWHTDDSNPIVCNGDGLCDRSRLVG